MKHIGMLSLVLGVAALTLTGCPPVGLQASFVVSPDTEGVSPFTANFINRTSGGHFPYQHTWDFGVDGAADSNDSSPSYIYETSGNYTVTLTVVDGEGMVDTATETIAVSPPSPPEASFEADTRIGPSPLTVIFTSTSTPGSSGGITEYRWNFGSDTDVTSSASTSHTFTEAGQYTVALEVVATNGNTATHTEAYFIEVTDDEVLVTAGKFRMGVPDPFLNPQDYDDNPDLYGDIQAPEDSSEYQDETEWRWIYLDEYRIGKYEVTNTEYAKMLNDRLEERVLLNETDGVAMQSTNYILIGVGSSDCRIYFADGIFKVLQGYEDMPVATVTWYGAAYYCNWLSEQYSLTPCYDANLDLIRAVPDGFRLPTEAEWERAAGWDDSRSELVSDDFADLGWMYIYPVWADALTTADANVNQLNTVPLAVGSFAEVSSPAGCLDMAGNLAEWCNDWYETQYNPDDTINPLASSSGGLDAVRVVRGGSFMSTITECRTSNRDSKVPDSYSKAIGFRVARYVDSVETEGESQ
jgi:formylglycine-generating enzyme required for sulfatase activity